MRTAIGATGTLSLGRTSTVRDIESSENEPSGKKDWLERNGGWAVAGATAAFLGIALVGVILERGYKGPHYIPRGGPTHML